MASVSYHCNQCQTRIGLAPLEETCITYVTRSSCENVKVEFPLLTHGGFAVLGAYCNGCHTLLGIRVVAVDAGFEDGEHLVGKFMLVKSSLRRSDGRPCIPTLPSETTASTSLTRSSSSDSSE